MNFDIIRYEQGAPAKEALGLQRWRFTVWTDHRNIQVVLDRYTRETRPSTRHKFRAEQVYDRADRRNGTLTLNDVPRPQDVCDEAAAEAAKLIRVVVQDPRGVRASFGRPEGDY